MNIEEAFRVLDTVLQQDYLNDIQDLVFRQSWEGQTYSEIAEVCDYDSNYIKDVGSRLWKLLSEALEKNVNKSNFKTLLSQQKRSAFVGEAYSKGVGELQPTPVVASPDSEDIKAKNQSTKTEGEFEQSICSLQLPRCSDKFLAGRILSKQLPSLIKIGQRQLTCQFSMDAHQSSLSSSSGF